MRPYWAEPTSWGRRTVPGRGERISLSSREVEPLRYDMPNSGRSRRRRSSTASGTWWRFRSNRSVPVRAVGGGANRTRFS